MKIYLVIFSFLFSFVTLNAQDIGNLGNDHQSYKDIASVMFAGGTALAVAGVFKPKTNLASIGTASTTAGMLTFSEVNYLESVRQWEIAQLDFVNRVSMGCQFFAEKLILEQLRLLELYTLFFSVPFSPGYSEALYCNILHRNIAKDPSFYFNNPDEIKFLLTQIGFAQEDGGLDQRVNFLRKVASSLYAVNENRLKDGDYKNLTHQSGRRAVSRIAHRASQILLPAGVITATSVALHPRGPEWAVYTGTSLSMLGIASHFISIELLDGVENDFESFLQRSEIVCNEPNTIFLSFYRLDAFFKHFKFRQELDYSDEEKIKEVFCNIILPLAAEPTQIDLESILSEDFFDSENQENQFLLESLRLKFYLLEREEF